MKKILLLSLLTTLTFAQVDTTFYGLRGYEDLDGNTQLYFRMVSEFKEKAKEDNFKGIQRRDIFHYDVKNIIDSLFILDFIDFHQPLANIGKVVSDFEFVDNTLTDFYLCGDGVTSFEPNPIVVYNNDYNNILGFNSFQGTTKNLEITKIDSNINVYISLDGEPKGVYRNSFDNFDLIESTENLDLVSFNKNQSNIIFAENEQGLLLKSEDAGLTFSISDSTIFKTYENSIQYKNDYLNRFFLYDSDSLHIYRVIENQNNFKLVVSDSIGELGTWREVFQSDKNIFISHNSSKSGEIYFANYNQIYKSENYGETYNLFLELDKNISGIYKKPNSDLLYTTTPHKLLEISPDSIKVIKQLINYDALSYYPMHVGDKWFYEVSGIAQVGNIINPRYEGFLYWETKEINGDTLLNGFKYFSIIQTQIYRITDTVKYFERYDSLNNRVMLYHDSSEFNRFELSSTIGDTINAILFDNIYQRKPIKAFHFADSLFSQFGKSVNKKCFSSVSFSTESYFQLAKGFGLVYENGISQGGIKTSKLIACRINNTIYGDTTLVGVDEINLETIPTGFSLSQNYPNPFNPTTTIGYSIPSSSVFLSSLPTSDVEANNLQDFSSQSSQLNGAPQNDNYNVSLRVYDVLGREVKTLVNQTQKPGNYSVQFDASNLASGIYYYRLSAGNFIETKKMITLK